MTKKNYAPIVWGLAIAIDGLIILSIFSPRISIPKDFSFSILPLANAILNGLTFVCLLIALFAIRQKDTIRHRRFIFLAFTFSFLFLLSYLTYHFTMPTTKHGGPPFFRYLYLFILLTHILLAAIIVPLAMYTMSLALNGDIVQHRKIARWTMPVWLYVSSTGVIVYIMISPYYAF